MSIDILLKFLPENVSPFLIKWFGSHRIHFKITRNRNSKLGDYRRMPDNSFRITINSTLPPELFFFVLTHELAHLLAFEKYGKSIAPHGKEWKHTFREMLIESLSLYNDELKPIILKFSHSPKANFMASPDLVRYFHIENENPKEVFLETLLEKQVFIYRKVPYKILKKEKKKYLCKNLKNGKEYYFREVAKVEKYDDREE